MVQENLLKSTVIKNEAEALTAFLSDKEKKVALAELDRLFLLSASLGHIRIAEILLSNGARINATMPLGDTALMWAELKSQFHMVSFLISKGINVNAQTIAGDTALIYAAKLGQPEIVKLLAEAGANLDHKNKQGQTAFMVAEHADKKDVMESLLGLQGRDEAQQKEYGL